MGGGVVEGPERSGSRLTGMVCLSLFLHLAVFSLLLLVPAIPTPKRTFGPVYTVDLVSTPGVALEAKATAAAAAKELLTARTPPPATVLKRPLESAPVIPLRSVKSRPKSDPSLEKAMAEIRRRAALPTPGPAATPSKAPAAPAASPAAPPAAGPAAGPGEGRLDAYYGLLWSRIRSQWALPPGMLADQVLEAVVGVSILRSGAVTAIHFEKRSGNRYFDDSALKAIEKATPFPPFPEGVGGKSVEVGIRFHSAELRR